MCEQTDGVNTWSDFWSQSALLRRHNSSRGWRYFSAAGFELTLVGLSSPHGEKALGMRWSCLILRWQLCPSGQGGQAGICTWKYERVLLTFGYWVSQKPSGFFLTALNIDYLMFITWMQLKMLLWKNPSSTNLSSEKRVRVYFHAHNWRHNHLF